MAKIWADNRTGSGIATLKYSGLRLRRWNSFWLLKLTLSTPKGCSSTVVENNCRNFLSFVHWWPIITTKWQRYFVVATSRDNLDLANAWVTSIVLQLVWVKNTLRAIGALHGLKGSYCNSLKHCMLQKAFCTNWQTNKHTEAHTYGGAPDQQMFWRNIRPTAIKAFAVWLSR